MVTPTQLEARVKILVLAARHVHELLGYRECADVMREALAELARGQIQQPLRTIVRPRDAAGFMALMPAYSPAAGLRAEGDLHHAGQPGRSARTRTRAGCCCSRRPRGSRWRW